MRNLPLILIVILLLVTACGQAEPEVVNEPEAAAVVQEVAATDLPEPTAVPTEEPTEEAMMEEGTTAESDGEAMSDDDAMVDDEAMSDDDAMMEEDEAMSDDDAMMEDEAMADDDAMMEEDEAMSDDDAMMEEDEAMSDDDAMMEEDEAMSDDDAMMEESDSDAMAESDSDDDAMMDDDSHDDDAMMDDEAMSDDGDEMMESDDTAAMESEDTMVEEAAPAVNLPAWQTLPLVNVATGQTFTLADYAGKTVFVEPMATWCGNCRQQLSNVLNAMAATGGDDVAFVVLSVETNLSNEQLNEYAQSNGYPFDFAVMTPELLQALVGEFGRGISNPPSTPHFIIRPDGTFTGVATGLESTQQLIDEINAN